MDTIQNTSSGNPVKIKMTPKDFFLNLGMIATLYITAISLLNLLFEIINRVFPDNLNTGYYSVGYYSTTIRWTIACLFIIFPLHVFFVWFLNRGHKLDISKINLGIRKWLVYITLALALIAIATDAIVTINYFLSGEISTRFIMKVLAILVVTGGIFGYYLYEIIKPEQAIKKSAIFSWISAVLILASVIGGFVVIGSPMRQRQVRFDERRIQDLNNLQYQVINYWQTQGQLPEKLSEMDNKISGYTAPKDPDTRAEYGYNKKGAKTFEVCAVFSLSSEDLKNKDYSTTDYNGYYNYNTMYKGGDTDVNWNWEHKVGYSCFERSIDENIYKPNVRVMPVPTPVQ